MAGDEFGRVRTRGEIPLARFYVACTDRCMSGWGPAEGLDNVLIFPTDSLATAERLCVVLRGRGDMQRVRVSGSRPAVRATWFAQVKEPADFLRDGVAS